MNPEQRLLIVHKDLTIEIPVFLLRTLIGMLVPQRCYVVQCNRTFKNFIPFSGRLYLNGLLLSVFIFLFFRLCRLYHSFNNRILISQFILFNRLILGLCLCIVQENRNRHKGAVFVQYLSCTILIGKLIAVLIQIQSNRRSLLFLLAVLHLKGQTSVGLPVNRGASFFVRPGINGYLICNHKCRIKSQSEMADDLILIGFILIFFQEILSAGKSNLVNILLYLFCSHAQSVICHGNRLFIWIYSHLNLIFQILRTGILAHQLQLF